MNISGEQFNNDFLSVFVPTGWKLFYGANSDGKPSPKKLHVYKNAQTELDILSKAGITICLYERNEIFISPKAFYDNVQDINAFELGGYLWNGFTCTSLNYPYTMLDSACDGITLQVMILMENGDHRISLDDIDVRSIIESISTYVK